MLTQHEAGDKFHFKSARSIAVFDDFVYGKGLIIAANQGNSGIVAAS